MEPKTQQDAHAVLEELNERIGNAEWAASHHVRRASRPGFAAKAVELKAEADRIRRLLPTLPK